MTCGIVVLALVENFRFLVRKHVKWTFNCVCFYHRGRDVSLLNSTILTLNLSADTGLKSFCTALPRQVITMIVQHPKVKRLL